MKSKDIQDKYGESPVFITFDYDEGKIYHMISHFYLQRSETRTKRQKAGGADYLDEKGIPIGLREKYAKLGIDKSTLGDVESAFTSSAMMSKIIFDKKEQMKKKANPRKENDPQKI